VLDVAVPVDVAVAEGTARKALVVAPRQYRFGRCPHAGIDASTPTAGSLKLPSDRRPSPVPTVSYGSQHQERTAANEEPVSDIRRITVLRCNAPGDHLMTTPALTALRDTFPHAEITLLAGAWHADFLSGRPSPVDRVLVVPEVGDWPVNRAGHRRRTRCAIPRRRAATATTSRCNCTAVGRRRTRSLGARWSIGLVAENAAPLDATVPYRYYQSEVCRYLEVVALVGAQAPPEYLELAVTAREHAVAAELLPGDGP
jgi:hypothetical protein